MLRFVRFTRQHYPQYRAWCEDQEARRWLGLPDETWLAYVTTAPDSFTWMIDEESQPVACVQADLVENLPSHASVAIIVAPERRRQGVGRRVLAAAVAQPELAQVTHLHAFVEPDNTASRRLLAAAGFALRCPEPDEHGLLAYCWMRGS